MPFLLYQDVFSVNFLCILVSNVGACPYMLTYRFGTSGTRYLVCHNIIIIWGTRYVMYRYDIIDKYKFLILSSHNIVKCKGLYPLIPVNENWVQFFKHSE